MSFPDEITKEFLFQTDLKSLLRGLNAILGLGNIQSRLRSIRLDQNGRFFTASTQFDLVRFAILTKELTECLESENKVIFYDDSDDTFKILERLSGDTKEALIIKESVESKKYLQSLIRPNVLRQENMHSYKNVLSAVLDSYQINNGILYLIHMNDESFIVNRGLTPDITSDHGRFFFYSRIWKLKDDDEISKANFVQVNRRDLTIQGLEKTKYGDLTQMILPIVHLHPLT
jgi:hypothetical protein